MRILVCGANGFIGRTIAEHLAAAGHHVPRGVRRPRGDGEIAVDYMRDLREEDWRARLVGVDVVVNAVGILVETAAARFSQIHHQAPVALFAACAAAGVGRVVQISSLGTARGDTRYFASKLAADEALMASSLEWHILRPSLVYGTHGESARLFRMLASVPVHFLPGGGRQPVQPVHIDELAECVLRAVEGAAARQVVDVVGSQALSYRELLGTYRHSMGWAPALQINIPGTLIDFAAHTVGRLPGVMLTPDTWKMLNAGNVADVAACHRLLGRAPRGAGDFISAQEAVARREEALGEWMPLLFRGVLALLWLWSALVSLFLYPQSESLKLLAAVGLHGSAGVAVLYGASALDAAFGVATLLAGGRRLWLAQGALIMFYSAVIGWALPDFLWHPFAPIVKNLAVLALLFVLYARESGR